MHRAIGPNNTPLSLEFALLQSARNAPNCLISVFRMHKLFPSSLSAEKSSRRQTVHRLQLWRPSVHPTLDIPLKCADGSYLLRLTQQLFSFAQFFFHLLAASHISGKTSRM